MQNGSDAGEGARVFLGWRTPAPFANRSFSVGVKTAGASTDSSMGNNPL